MNIPYALLPIGILAVILYLASLLLSRFNLIRKKTHRQIWNVILLTTFLVTAVLGLILAVQVNYRIEVPWIKELLVWHVNFGIGMAFAGIFHVLWHLTYFSQLLKLPVPARDKGGDEQDFAHGGRMKNNSDLIPVISLGLTAMITQIILLREFISAFYGNELIIGIILANWLILTGLGARSGRIQVGLIKENEGIQGLMLLVLSVLAILAVIVINAFKNKVFPPGVVPGPYQILFVTFILLAPFCLLSGYMFTFFSSWLSAKNRSNIIFNVYAAESAGSLTGGILFSFILVYFFNSLQVLGIVLVLNLLVAFLIGEIRKQLRLKWLWLITGILFLAGIYLFDANRFFKEYMYPNQELVYLKETPYGSLAVSKTAEQLNFFENTSLLFSTGDPVFSEETVHYALSQLDNIENVLLVSGGLSGTLPEILKHDIKQVDYIEQNPGIIKVGREYTDDLNHEVIHTVEGDPRLYLKKTETLYDAILMVISEPSTLQQNRFYTKEFFTLAYGKLKPGGVLSLSLPSTTNYVSTEANNLNSVIYNTLKTVFKHVLIVPGNRNYFIGADKQLNLNIPQLIADKEIENVYVNQYFIDYTILQERCEMITGQLDEYAEINRDFRPVCFLQQLKFWLSRYNINFWFPLAIIVLIFLMLMWRIRPVTLGLFAGGFAGTGMELVIILAFQIIYGYVYQYIGIIIGVFMAGLAFGALYGVKWFGKTIKSLLAVQGIIVVYACAVPFILIALHRTGIPAVLLHSVMLILTFIIAVLIGMLFAKGSVILKSGIARKASDLYSYDLYGSALGSLLISVLLIPLLGFIGTALVVAGVNFIALLVVLANRKSYI